jgi:alpha-D-xyloside xylohydrolase
MQQATQTGLPVQRAMVLAFPEDKAAWAFEDQYMFGDDLLVVPCLAPSGDIEFYLPQGQWYLFNAESSDDIQEFIGGQMHNLTMPLDQIAVFIQSNKKIALGASVEHTEQLDDIENIVAYWPA